MLENLIFLENINTVPKAEEGNSVIIDLENSLKFINGNGNFNPLRSFLTQLKTQTLDKSTIIAGFAKRLRDGHHSNPKKYWEIMRKAFRDLRENIGSMECFVLNDYSVLARNSNEIGTYIGVVNDYVTLIARCLEDIQNRHNLDEILQHTEALEKTMGYKDKQEISIRRMGLNIIDTILSAVYDTYEKGTKVKGSFSYQKGLPLIIGDGATRLGFGYLINKGLREGDETISIHSELSQNNGQRYILTTISPSKNYLFYPNLIDRAARFIGNALALKDGKINSNQKNGITLVIAAKNGYPH